MKVEDIKILTLKPLYHHNAVLFAWTTVLTLHVGKGALLCRFNPFPEKLNLARRENGELNSPIC